MHQDYSEHDVWQELDKLKALSEAELGERLVRRCITKQHWGVCYDSLTEVLTQRGWVNWDDVLPTDKLAAFDLKTEHIAFETPEKLIKFYTEEPLYVVEGQSINFAVTLDHKMIVAHRQKSGKFTNWYRIEAKEKVGKPYKVPKAGFLKEDEHIAINNPFTLPDLDFCRLIGFWVGDGNRLGSKNQLKFHLKRQRKIDFLKKIIPPEYLTQKENNCWTVNLEDIGTYFTNNFSKDKQKILPSSYMFLPPKQAQALLDGLLSSDGTKRRSESQVSYDSTSLDLINTIQSLITLNGLSANITLNGKTATDKHKQCYRLNITEHVTQRIEACQKNRTPSITESVIDYKGYVYCAKVSTGALVVRREGKTLISGNCEHPSITLNAINFPHSVIVQARTHRICSFDVQSNRFTSKRILKLSEAVLATPGDKDKLIEEVFYFRPVGYYLDRVGNKYFYSEEERQKDFDFTLQAVNRYADRVATLGYAPEHARDLLTQNIRQHFVVTFNARSLLHFCDLRLPKDAQAEIGNLAQLLFQRFSEWMPEVSSYYLKTRYGKSKIAP
jgi:thymidylate synthase (FAD)